VFSINLVGANMIANDAECACVVYPLKRRSAPPYGP